MADQLALETRQLVKEFKGFVAVDDVNLKVNRDHILFNGHEAGCNCPQGRRPIVSNIGGVSPYVST